MKIYTFERWMESGAPLSSISKRAIVCFGVICNYLPIILLLSTINLHDGVEIPWVCPIGMVIIVVRPFWLKVFVFFPRCRIYLDDLIIQNQWSISIRHLSLTKRKWIDHKLTDHINFISGCTMTSTLTFAIIPSVLFFGNMSRYK